MYIENEANDDPETNDDVITVIPCEMEGDDRFPGQFPLEQGDICRICRIDVNVIDDRDNLLSPCACSGSMKYVHIECHNEADLGNMCNVCGFRFPGENRPINFPAIPVQLNMNDRPEPIGLGRLNAVLQVNNALNDPNRNVNMELYRNIAQILPVDFHGAPIRRYANEMIELQNRNLVESQTWLWGVIAEIIMIPSPKRFMWGISMLSVYALFLPLWIIITCCRYVINRYMGININGSNMVIISLSLMISWLSIGPSLIIFTIIMAFISKVIWKYHSL